MLYYFLITSQRMLEPLNPLTQGSFLSFAELFWFMVGDKRHAFTPAPVLTFADAHKIFMKAVREVSNSSRNRYYL